VFTVIVVFHVLVSLALILVVLMQSSKGEGLAGSAFGGGGGLSGAVFGGRGAASFLSRATTVLAVLFMLNSGALALMSSGNRGVLQSGTGQSESVVTQEAQKERERAIQQQQQQQGQTPAESLQIPNLDVSNPKSSDTSGQ